MRPNVAGVDVHKAILAITILTGDADKEPKVQQFECNTFSEDLMAMAMGSERSWGYRGCHGVHRSLLETSLQCVVEDGNQLYGWQRQNDEERAWKKNDMNDSHWIAQLHRFGLIKASFIPEDKFQQLRLLSRHRTNLTDDLARIKKTEFNVP